MQYDSILIFTDGSCHTQQLIGAWVAIIFLDNDKITISGTANNTTHNRMELTAIIKAIEYLQEKEIGGGKITIISDSQYAIGLEGRRQKFMSQRFLTKKGKDISNADMVKIFLNLLITFPINFEKIKAHQKVSGIENFNIEADKLARNLVRQTVNNSNT